MAPVGRKTTVEQSRALAIQDFRGRNYPKSSGTFSRIRADGNEVSVGYEVTWDAPCITLSYFWRGEDFTLPVFLETTPMHLGGERWWFTCPLIVGGTACNRRAGKLYLPPGGQFFGCRVCHDLTYQSSQEAHLVERVAGRIVSMERRVDTLRNQLR